MLAGMACRAPVPLAPEEAIAEAWQCFRWREYDRALARFEMAEAGLEKGAPGYWEAVYGTATVWGQRLPLEKRDTATAARLYARIIEEAPASDQAAWAMLDRARLAHLRPVGEQVDYVAVAAAYHAVYTAYPEHPAGHEALACAVSTRLLSFDAAAAEACLPLLDAFAEAHPESRFISQVLRLQAQCCQYVGRYEAQLAAELRALERFEEDPLGYVDMSVVYWRIATLAEFDVGDFETARRFYRRLIEEEPTNPKHFPSKMALERMDRIEAAFRDEMAVPVPEGPPT